ncbi:hypothetical protein [Paraburkholderia sp. C35]|uniref:hypothetical protein n=1 Tax=Paraburkholderia sp. C35 TaxID=2126993 RepID=UPI000D6A0080|nr:hypothetical protein [Paraburkholderia sp. C35]
MNTSRTVRAALLVAICMATLLVVAFNIANLVEAYGNGPPYYSRTVNMDKWQSPLPVLAAIDMAALLILAFAVRCWRRADKRQ